MQASDRENLAINQYDSRIEWKTWKNGKSLTMDLGKTLTNTNTVISSKLRSYPRYAETKTDQCDGGFKKGIRIIKSLTGFRKEM